MFYNVNYSKYLLREVENRVGEVPKCYPFFPVALLFNRTFFTLFPCALPHVLFLSWSSQY